MDRTEDERIKFYLKHEARIREGPVRRAMVLLLLLVVSPVGAGAQTRGLFADVGPAQVSPVRSDRSGTSRVSTVRSRPVQVDLGRLATIQTDVTRTGSSVPLTLNLFDDAVFPAVIDMVAPTGSGGYALFGRLDGIELGTVTLVVNGDVVAGTVRTPATTYAVRSTGRGGYVVREVDPAQVLNNMEPLAPVRPDAAAGSSDLLPSSREGADSRATDEGPVIDVAVFYTSAVRDAEGGTAAVEALIDLFVAETNEAYGRSNVVQRINLVWKDEVAYTDNETKVGRQDVNLERFQDPADGHVDEIHAIRDVFAADLVHVIVGGQDCAGFAFIMTEVSHGFEASAFSITTSGCADLGGLVFAHELSHNMGLRHDRYAVKEAGNLDATNANRPYPYSYGYVNQRAFEANASASARWRTVMAAASDDQCGRAGFDCPPVFHFSNPDQSLNGDALGVPGDQMSLSVDGPANARRSLDDTRQTVARFRASSARDTCTYALAPNRQLALPAGGEFEVKVTTKLGCAWDAASNDGFLSVKSGATDRGRGAVTYSVAANGGARRTGTLNIAGQTFTVDQIGPNTPGICTRTSRIQSEITRETGREHCWEVTDADLAGVTNLDLARLGLEALPASDLAGLTGLERLWLYDNRLMTLRADTFAELTGLEVLGLVSNRLTELPADIFTGLSRLRILHLSENQLATVPASIAGLTNLENLYLYDNQFVTLPPGIFANLPALKQLWLHNNRITELPEGVFAGCRNVEDLLMSNNRLTELPAGVFAGLANLKYLSLYLNEIEELPGGIFVGLTNLEGLELWGNPGAPFPLTLQLARTDSANTAAPGPATVVVRLTEGAPFEMPVSVSATGGTLSTSAATVAAGAEQSEPITVTQSGASPVTVRLDTPPAVPDGFYGMRTEAGPPLVLVTDELTHDRIYYFPHLAVGASWQTTITYINHSSEEVTCKTDFLSDLGDPLPVSFPGPGMVESRIDVLPPGGSVHEETDVDLSAPLAPGWAKAACTGAVKASLLFRQHDSAGVPVAEAGVNATTVPATRFVTFAEQAAGQAGTGVAYANPSSTEAIITFTARNAAGQILVSEGLTVSPGGHGAQSMADLFGLPGFNGSLEVASTEPVVSLSLNFEAAPVFSSLPPGEPDAAAQGPITYYFPHLAVGASWQTTITYINHSSEEVTCKTDFLSDLGDPLPVSFPGPGMVESRIDVLPPGGSVHEETDVDLSAPLAPGWAKAACTGAVKASLLFRQHDSAGVPVAEAGVNATTVPATRFVTFAEQAAGQAGTGVAYANPSSTEAIITFTARNAAGQILVSEGLTVSPGGHGAQSMADLFGLPGFNGSLEVASTEPVVSLSLNFEAAPVFSSLPPGEPDAAAP